MEPQIPRIARILNPRNLRNLWLLSGFCLKSAIRNPQFSQPSRPWYPKSTVVPIVLLLLALVLPAAPAAAQSAGRPLREQELEVMVHSKTMFTEAQIIEMLQTRGIGFRLTDATRKTLRKEGASTAVLAALDKAADRQKRASTADEAKTAAAPTAGAAPKPAPPPLDPPAQREFLERVRANALQYTDKLPNYLCLQVTRRYVDWAGTGNFRPEDVIQARLAYNEKKESYQTIRQSQVNGTKEQWSEGEKGHRDMDSLGGATSTGEFGTMLHEVFAPESKADFQYLGPASFNGRPVHVFEYDVPQLYSHYAIVWNRKRPDEQGIIAGYHGRIVVDPEKEQVLRLWMEAEDIPARFPIRAAVETLDYDYATIAGVPYLLPARAVMEMKESRLATRNEIAFLRYQRFSAEIKLGFEEPPPEERQPAQPQMAPRAKKP
jgi:hypothetical protein